jgi:hypothetical protein
MRQHAPLSTWYSSRELYDCQTKLASLSEADTLAAGVQHLFRATQQQLQMQC